MHWFLVVNELTAGSNQLTIGFDTFKTKSIMLTDGIDKLHKGSEAFKEGLLKIYERSTYS